MELVRTKDIRLKGPADFGADSEAYAAPVAGGYTVLYRVTRDQLRVLAQAEQIRMVAESRPGSVDEYTVWNGAEEGFRLFSNYLLDDADIVFAAVR
jgi:hypothetical protein